MRGGGGGAGVGVRVSRVRGRAGRGPAHLPFDPPLPAQHASVGWDARPQPNLRLHGRISDRDEQRKPRACHEGSNSREPLAG